MNRRLTTLAAVAAVAIAAAGTAFATSGSSSTASDYTAVAATRLADTVPAHQVGPVTGPIGGGKTLTVTLSGVPAGATAVVLTVTVTAPSLAGYATVYGDGATRPATSNLNFAAGQTVANEVTVPVSDGKVDVYNGAGNSQYIVDLEGYYTPTAAAYTPPQTTFSATTVVSNWPESSGWATDNFNRAVTLTLQHAVPASDCSSTATACYFYTESLADNGSFTTVNGKASPNGSSTATIGGVVNGAMVGGGKLEFYASSDTPNPSLVPATASGASGLSTTSWYELFFASGTEFGNPTEYPGYGPWVAYDWTYTTTCQKWNDGINPGDDGQGVADGNITGTCTS